MKKGFTLIELLIAVMVIAVLAAVAVPQYRRSMERSRIMEFVQLAPAIHDSLNRYFAENADSEDLSMPPLSVLDFSAKGSFANDGKDLVTPNFAYAAAAKCIVGRVRKGRFKGTLFIFALHPGQVTGNLTPPLTSGEAAPDWYCWEGSAPKKGACQFMGITQINAETFQFKREGAQYAGVLNLSNMHNRLANAG